MFSRISCCCYCNGRNSEEDETEYEVILIKYFFGNLLLTIFLLNFSVFFLFSEIEQSLAGLISDRATDEVLEALTRYRKGMGVVDLPYTHAEELLTPDVIRRSSQVSLFCRFLKILRLF